MWVVPGEGGKHGRIYFGYHDGFAQGGVNDAGLFFDGLALDHEEVAKSDKPEFDGHPGDLALATCTTVREVVELFEKHDRQLLSDAQLFFGDKTGDGVVFEGNAVVRKTGPYLLATNFRQSEVPPKLAGCGRYDGASKLLDGMKDVTVDACRRILATTHQEGEYPTVYSNVYDLANGKIHLYHFHDFDQPVVVDVATEIAKGAHTVELDTLFPREIRVRDLPAAVGRGRRGAPGEGARPEGRPEDLRRLRRALPREGRGARRLRIPRPAREGQAPRGLPEAGPGGADPARGRGLRLHRPARAREFTFHRDPGGNVDRVRIVQSDVELSAERVGRGSDGR
jgi:hypothetical protein